MDWSDGAEKYLAAHYGETIDDPRPPLDAVEPPACEECGEDVLEAAERLCDTCLANERGRSLLAPSCTDCGQFWSCWISGRLMLPLLSITVPLPFVATRSGERQLRPMRILSVGRTSAPHVMPTPTPFAERFASNGFIVDST